MKFVIFAVNLTLLLSFRESKVLEDKDFVIGIKNLDLVRSALPKDQWYEELYSNDDCSRLLNSMWIFPENYSDTSEKPPFAMIHKKYEAFSIGTLILYYDNESEEITAFCCQHDENMAIYIAHNTHHENSYIAFRKTSIDGTMTLGLPKYKAASYEENVSSICNYYYFGYVNISLLEEAVKPTYYCLSFFWRLSRYEMEGYEALTIMSELSEESTLKLQCQSFLFAEVQNGYFLSYDIEYYELGTAYYQCNLNLKGNDEVDLNTLGHVEP